MLRSDRAKRAMLKSVAETGPLRFWPVRSLLHGWGIDDPDVAAVLEPLPRIPPEERQHIASHVPAIVASADESFRLLMEICDLPDVSRTDFVVEGFAALGDAIDQRDAVSAVLPHVRKSPAIFQGHSGLITEFHADPRVREFALERLREPSPPLAEMAGVYAADNEIAPLILERAAPLPKVFRRYIARRASQRFDDEALRQVLQRCGLETDEHAMTQATIGLSYAALAIPGEARARTEALGTQLHVIGPRYDDRRAAALGGLLALGSIDVFAHAKDGGDGEALKIDLVKRFSDYAPVRELAAERWEELETATEGSPVNRFSRWKEDPAAFWGSVCTLPEPLTSLEDEVSRILRGRVRLAEGLRAGGAVTPQTGQLFAARLLQTGLLRGVRLAEMGSLERCPIHRRRVEVSRHAVLRRSLGGCSGHCGKRQSAGAGGRLGRIDIVLAGPRCCGTRVSVSR